MQGTEGGSPNEVSSLTPGTAGELLEGVGTDRQSRRLRRLCHQSSILRMEARRLAPPNRAGVRFNVRRLALLLLFGVVTLVGTAVVHQVAMAQTAGPVNLDEDGSGDVSVGDTLVYEITATNSGSVTLTNVVISDVLSGQSTTCATLGAGETCVLTASYVVRPSDIAAGQISTTATANSNETGPVPLPAPATLFVPVPALSVDAPKLADSNGGIFKAGDTVTLVVTATNTGNANLTNVVVKDERSTPAADSAPCDLLPPGGICAFTGTYVVTAADITAAKIEDKATADSNQTESVEQSGSIDVLAPGLTITRSGTLDLGADGLATPGDAMTLTYRVENTGNVALINVTVQDPQADVNCAVGTLAPGAVDATTCSGTYLLTQADIDDGAIGGLAEAQGLAASQVVTASSPPDSAALSLPQEPALTVERVLSANADEDGSDDVSFGDSLTFEVRAFNSGNVMLTNVVVGDRLTGDETSCASLAPVSACVLTTRYEVTRANADSGSIPNLAYASSDQTGDVSALTSEVEGVRIYVPTNFLIETPGWSGVSTDISVVGTNLTLALIALITLLVATTVFNSTLEENAADVDALVKRVSGSSQVAPVLAALGWMSADEAGGESRLLRIAKPAVIVIVTALIYALLDPSFGFNDETLVVVAALIAGIAMSTFLYEGGQVLWATRNYDTGAAMRLYPLAILIALACVGLTRITSLHPGIIFGFVTAAAIFPRGEMSKRANGLIIAVPLIALMLVSLAAFLLIDPMHHLSTTHSSVLATLPETVAVALFVGGAESALLILIPVTFNDGEKIWEWSKLIWFALALPAAFAFIHVIVNDEDYGELVSDTNTVALVGICLAVLVISMVTWLYFKMRESR